MTRPEAIRAWVEREFTAKHVNKVTADLIDVAAGNRPGNRFEREALERIFPKCPQCGNTENLETDQTVSDYSCEACELSFNAKG